MNVSGKPFQMRSLMLCGAVGSVRSRRYGFI